MSDTQYQRGKFRILGCPWRYAVVRTMDLKKELPAFLQHCVEKGLPAFESMYDFTKADTENKTVDRDSAIVNCIKFDIDGPDHETTGVTDPRAELIKFMDFWDSHNIAYFINFSGNSGYAVKIPFPSVQLKYPYQVVTELYNRVSDLSSVYFDPTVKKGTSQMFRIVNSQHQKSGLYAVPLTSHEARTMTLDEVRGLAVQPREIIIDENIARENNVAIQLICQGIDTDIKKTGRSVRRRTANKEQSLPVLNSELQDYRPCTRTLMQNGTTGFDADNIIAFEMIFLGKSDAEIHEWSQVAHGTRYSVEQTQYHIDILRKKIGNGDLFLHGCRRIKEAGFCVYPDSPNYTHCKKVDSRLYVDVNDMLNLQQQGKGKHDG